MEDDLVDRYFVHVTTRASWLFSASMPVSSTKKMAAAARERAKRRRDAARRLSKKQAAAASKKDAEASNKAKVKKEEEVAVPVRVWKCKKNDGKRWHCHRTVSQPNTLCKYHFVQKRAYLNPDFELDPAMELEEEEEAPAPAPAAAPKPSSNSKSRKKKPSSDFIATEGFYYYAGFGPFRSKRHCRSSGTNEPVPAKQEEEEEVPEPEDDASPPAADQARTAEDTKNQAAAKAEVSSCDDDIAGIAGADEDSSDDDYDGIGIAGSSMDPRARNGDGKRKTPWKRWRKPVKARSLMSLM